jgi:hypothetical protein
MTNYDYLFKVTHPIRATLHVTRDEKGGFEVAECRAASNYNLSKAEREKVEADLRKALATSGEIAA